MAFKFPSSDQIHKQAMDICLRYKKSEAELIEVLQRVERHRVHLERGHSSLFRYVVDELKLGENTAYALITVSRKARQIPELHRSLKTGEITLSNARRVAVVLTKANKSEWLQKARELSNRQLEKEIARVRPQAMTPEKATYVSADRIKLELGLGEEAMHRLRRAQDLLSQARQRPVLLEEVIELMTSEFLKKHDPVERAKRIRARILSDFDRVAPNSADTDSADASPANNNSAVSIQTDSGQSTNMQVSGISKDLTPLLVTLRVPTSREPIPASVLHRLYLRDQGKCTQRLPNGTRCNQSRWVEIHHKIPVSRGGTNQLGNLTTLCSAHHLAWHRWLEHSGKNLSERIAGACGKKDD